MNEQVSMMNQHQQQQQQSMVMTALTQPPPPQPITQQHLQHAPPQPHSQLTQMLMNPPLPQQPQQMMNRNYGMWPPPPAGPMDRHQPNFRKPNTNSHLSGYVSGGKPLGPRNNNWKGKKANNNKRRDFGRRMEGPVPIGGASGSVAVAVANTIVGGVGIGGGYKPPTLNELQHQNRVKARRFFPKKNFNNKSNNFNRGKFAPRNTSSFIIRAKKSGGITELVSPYAVTPAVLPTPMFSPSREVLMDMAKEEWGVDGYGSMKGLIRLRPSGGGQDAMEGQEEEESDEGGSSGSDVEEHVEVERRLDHDLSRFEMIYPNYGAAGGMEHNNILENRVDDQDSHIAQLEEENLILKERLFLMEREFGDLRRRMQFLERRNQVEEDINEEVEENESDNDDSDSNEDVHSLGVHQVEEINNEEMVDEIDEGDGDGDVDATSIEEEGIEGIKKEEEKSVQELDNTDKAKFKVVELKEQIYGIDLVDDENVKEKNKNKSSSKMVEESTMGMNDIKVIVAPPVGEEMITEDEKTIIEDTSDDKSPERRGELAEMTRE